MSQEKAQLIAPLGNMSVPGVTATGVITATSFEGNIAGSATSIKQGSSISAGVVTASSFAGNLTGNIQRLADSGPNISVGVVTATSFSGNLTGSVTDLTSAPAITVGVVTATTLKGPVTGNITGNVSGHAGGLGVSYNGGWPGAGTSQISAGVMTATSFYGDGSNLDGVSSGPVSQQAVTANSGTTAIDLSNGNLIYMTQSADTTVSFANTENGNVYIIRTKDDTSTARTITWPTGIGWSGGSAPTLMNNPRGADAQVFLLVTRDMGVTWYGKEVMRSDPQTYETYVFGSNGSGQLGQNDDVNRSSPIQLPGNNWNTANTRANGTYNAACLATKTDGTLWSWGTNTDGQLGLGNKTKRSSPTQLPGIEATWASNLGEFGVAAGGELWAWGANHSGILGQNGAYQIGNYKISSPVQVPGTTWRSVSGWHNNQHSRLIATKTDGTLWGWGGNTDGGIGDGSKTDRSSPTQIGTGTDWSTEGHVSYYSTHHIKTDGTLWSWGQNYYGQFGLNNRGGPDKTSPIQTPGTWSKFTGDTDGGVLAIKTDGTAWGWGLNEWGMLGLNQAHDLWLSSPTQIGTDTTWSDIKSSNNKTIGTKTDGTAWSWGYNANGQLGLNNKTAYSSPVQIPGTWENPRWLSAHVGSLQKPV